MLSKTIHLCHIETMRKDLVMQFGNPHDGVIEFAALVQDGIIEVGYFYGDNMPKNIIAISSQAGCVVGCKFCSMGNSKRGDKAIRNLTPQEIVEQVILMLRQVEEYSFDIDRIEHKVSIAKSGEPLFNPHIVAGIELIASLDFSMKVSTVIPYKTTDRLLEISKFASDYTQPIQLQISLISTSQEFRNGMTRNKLASFEQIRKAAEQWHINDPFKRKINLSLMMTQDNPFDCQTALKHFPPDIFKFRLRLYVPNNHGRNFSLSTAIDKNYQEIKKQLEDAGYETGDWAIPSRTEQRFGLASNVTRDRYIKMTSGKI